MYEFARSNIDDAHKRKLPRIKVRGSQHRLPCPIPGNIVKWKLRRVVLAFIVSFVIFVFLWTATNCPNDDTSHSVSRWIWRDLDPRYASEIDVDWEEVSRTLNPVMKDNIRQEVGLLNFDENEIHRWKRLIPDANHTVLSLEYAHQTVTWESLYPEWIDEDQENEVPICPSLPSIKVPRRRLDLIVVKLPCPDKKWSRDIARLHLQIAAARLAASYNCNSPVHILLVTPRFPTPNLFRCNDLVARHGSAWLYRPKLQKLREKLRLPVGSCELAASIDYSIMSTRKREAYATILHSDNAYVCGAIVAARSIRMSGSTRDLVILVDESIGDRQRRALEMAGWRVWSMDRIRNPKAEKESYNEWNYSKFRLWQMTDYDKIVFIDADMVILRNIDFLFGLPEISATGNDGAWFNSGVMVIEPSNCTFRLLMEHVEEIESANGGDQGYLNEIFTWWHRLPRRVNFLKHFWSGDGAAARERKVRMMAAEAPEVFVVHYLGNKPWMCFRDYDCNWNVERLREFASDAAHRRWWKVHDGMEEGLREMCLLRAVQKAQLEIDRREAAERNFSDGHWRMEIRDGRLGRCAGEDRDCNWKGMLNHWVKKTTPLLSSSSHL
ncbi:UDP-glucuronate:xylan alpha-glucuronosyltransferase 1-like [Andrographis paniculata]|uniref:UDP-glucuronate:xylan alpha-glucuronosyltransferase 1-like n=1 Tax=Andrographis paniculata TaxID=175694 RepID=UPI0021E94929|nr:UDP-glucuronate:xylan alpha-glucuronosyltransferase 1-like [Andrographis paniculata]